MSKYIELSVDFHSHTHFSDGKHSPQQMVEAAQKRKIDVLAITDHNTLSGIIALKNSLEITRQTLTDIQVLAGLELSLAEGHFVCVFPETVEPETIDDQLQTWGISYGSVAHRTSPKQTEHMLDWLIQHQALVICAHPVLWIQWMSTPPDRLEQLYQAGLIHGAEVHNHDLDYKSFLASKKVYNQWHKRASRIVNELGIPAYANSDAHSQKRVGKRHNLIRLSDKVELLPALISGQAKISHKKAD